MSEHANYNQQNSKPQREEKTFFITNHSRLSKSTVYCVGNFAHCNNGILDYIAVGRFKKKKVADCVRPQ